MIDPASRPQPGSSRNLSCSLEYRPVPDATVHETSPPREQLGPDLRFGALSSPYDSTKFLHSPLDLFFHAIFAPGRHLREPLEIEGAVCEDAWAAGKRLPQSLRVRNDLFCRREGLAEVRFRAQTKHGVCEVSIPEGDRTPRCHVWTSEFMQKREAELLRSFGRPCADPGPGLVRDPEPPASNR